MNDMRTKPWIVTTAYNGTVVETQTVWSDSASQAAQYALHHNQSKLETSALPKREPNELVSTQEEADPEVVLQATLARIEGIKPESLTCFGCPSRATCEYVDDPYNTNGDCLALK